MGGRGSGNFLPKPTAAPEEKSINRSIRLNLRKESHRWLNDRIKAFLAEQAQLPDSEQRSIADWFVDLLLISEGQQPAQPTVIASAYDVADILNIVQYISDKIESADFSGRPAKRGRKTDKPVNLSESMRSTIDRYLGNGFVGGDDLDEDAD